MNIIEVDKWVAHKDARKGKVVEINGYRARVKWYYAGDRALDLHNSANALRVKRTWCQFKDLTVIDTPSDFKTSSHD